MLQKELLDIAIFGVSGLILGGEQPWYQHQAPTNTKQLDAVGLF